MYRKGRCYFGTYRYLGVSFTHHNIFPGAPVWFDDITIDGVYCSKPTMDNLGNPIEYPNDFSWYPIIWFAPGVTCGNVSLNNIHRIEESKAEAHTIQIDKAVNIERLMLNNITQRFINRDEVPLVLNRGRVEKLEGTIEI